MTGSRAGAGVALVGQAFAAGIDAALGHLAWKPADPGIGSTPHNSPNRRIG
jgi:hypothetical protein